MPRESVLEQLSAENKESSSGQIQTAVEAEPVEETGGTLAGYKQKCSELDNENKKLKDDIYRLQRRYTDIMEKHLALVNSMQNIEYVFE